MPDRDARRSFARHQLRTLLAAPVSPARMARRARLIGAAGTAGDCARVSAPTLVVSGDRLLDHVVSVDGTSEYLRLIAGARAVTLADTGHLGCVTRPDEFARSVRAFVADPSGGLDAGRPQLRRGEPHGRDRTTEGSTSDAA